MEIMCREADEFLLEIEKANPTEVRQAIARYLDADPLILSELKGISIARAVSDRIRKGQYFRSTLLAEAPETTTPGRLTKGFLKYFGVETIQELTDLTQFRDFEVNLVPVPHIDALTDEEFKFNPWDYQLPAVRLVFVPKVSTLTALT